MPRHWLGVCETQHIRGAWQTSGAKCPQPPRLRDPDPTARRAIPHSIVLPQIATTLTLQLHFGVGTLCLGLVGSSPKRPSNDKLRSNALSGQARCQAADFLH